MSTRPKIGVPLIFLVLLATTIAPDVDVPLRRWVTGKVLRVDGKPWAGAAVTLSSQPWGLMPRRGSEDRVETRCDANSNFKAKVLIARTYSAWALSPVIDG